MMFGTMAKQFKLMIIVNALLGLLYVVSSYFIWAERDTWSKWNIASKWTPIIIEPYHIPNTPQVQMPIFPMYNFPFILFCVMFLINLYFIIRFQLRKETEQAPS